MTLQDVATQINFKEYLQDLIDMKLGCYPCFCHSLYVPVHIENMALSSSNFHSRSPESRRVRVNIIT